MDGVSIHLDPGETVAVVGRSGAGKSTLVRLLLGLEKPDAGEVRWFGRSITNVSGHDLRLLRQKVQVVFQDPATSLDPLQRVAGIIAEPLAIHGLGEGNWRQGRVAELLVSVGLPDSGEFLARLPHELSGGQRQRVAIARAMATAPSALVLDEPVSALDASIQGQILALLARLQRDHGLAVLLVVHDLAVARAVCSRVVVIDAGRVAEEGELDTVFASPQAAISRKLVEAAREPAAPV